SVLSLSSIRFNSSASATPAAPVDAPAPPAVSEFAPFDTVTPGDLSSLSEAQQSITDHVGYLSELGLNFGWGPTSCIQWLMEHVHVWTGTPWWASILLTTLVIRTIQLPGYIKLSDTAAKMKDIQPLVAPHFEKMKEAQKRGDMVQLQIERAEMGRLYTKAGVSKSWLMFPITQIPVFYGGYNLLHQMADLPVPGFVNGGILWFTDLSMRDPYLILPIMTSLNLAASSWLGGEGGAGSISYQMKMFLVFGLPIISFAFMWSWPAAMTMYFAFNAVFGLMQNLILRNPKVREAIGLYPLPKPAPKPPSALNVMTPALNGQNETSAVSFADKFKKLLQPKEGEAESTLLSVSAWKDTLEAKNKRDNDKAYEKRRQEELAMERNARRMRKRSGSSKDNFEV
ncbi:60Kd inner membrane protein-domain-containing protein, partial [Peziza echinospora]